MSRTRDISNIFDDNSPIVNDNELIIAINTASAAAASYADSELAVIDLSSTIQTASAAAAAYTDQELSSIDLTSTIITASAAAVASANSYTDSELSTIDLTSTIITASAAAVNFLTDSAPGTLDTLNELSAALNDDPNFYSTIQAVYLSQSSASATYLTQSEGLTALSASSTYLTITAASETYEPDIPYVSASPSAPSAGTLWIDSTNSAAPSLKVYNGTTWIAVSGSDSGLHPFFTAGI